MDMCPDVGALYRYSVQNEGGSRGRWEESRREDATYLTGVDGALMLQRLTDETRERRGDGLGRAGPTTKDHAGADDGSGDLAGQVGTGDPVEWKRKDGAVVSQSVPTDQHAWLPGVAVFFCFPQRKGKSSSPQNSLTRGQCNDAARCPVWP